MAPIVVEPETLAGAGVSISGVGDELAAALSALAASLPNGAMAGHDRAGLVFGNVYRQAAQELMGAGADAVNGGRQVGFGVQVSATNYSRADASSTIGGGATPLTAPTAPGKFDAPSVPSPFGGGVAEPFLWSMVEMLVGDVWPDGDPAQLRAAGSAWSGFARTLSGIGGQLAGPSAAISGQQIPEGGAITKDLSDLKQGLSDIATESAKLSVQLIEFAADVEAAQNAIRDLLSRLSPAGIFDTFFSGDMLDELKEIAEDIRTVLDNLGRQADARQQSMQSVMQMLDDAVVSLQDKVRKEFTDVLGEDVGNALATIFDIQTNVGEAPVKLALQTMEGLQQLNPMRFAHDFEGAKESWSAVADTFRYADPMGIAMNPIGAFEHYKGQLEGLAHVEDWSWDRPGLGPAMVASEIGSIFIPGGAATRGTRAAAEAADVVEGAAPTVRAAGVLDNAAADTSAIAGRAEKISESLDHLGDNIPKVDTPSGPAVPRDLVEPPNAPRVPEVPGPRVPDAPTPHDPGSPVPHVSDSAPVDRSPTAPHSSTPTSTPTHADAGPGDAPPTSTPPIGAVPESRVPASVEAPSAPHQSTPAPAAPATAGHAPEPASVAAHAPSSPPAIHAPEAAPNTSHAPSSAAPEASPASHVESPSSGTDGGHSPDNAPPHQPHDPAGHDGDGGSDGHAGGGDHDHGDGHHPPRTGADAFPDAHDYGDLTEEQVDHEFRNADGSLRYPDEDDPAKPYAIPGTVHDLSPAEIKSRLDGQVWDRLGHPGGAWLAPEGTPYGERSLAPGSLEREYHGYRVHAENPLPDGWRIEESRAAPWFGQPGGGPQFRVISPPGVKPRVADLIGTDFLEELW